ncbi:MAG: type I glyceraldehyde-3-phosphate dehydrogenase [Candidatus Nanoarchaeia archaeon]|nr:type I glyceraldehyde-3-phosphate dehydrogenase [Candidatus Nanoarchaeia archaeon]
MANIAINGFGRIGRMVFRIMSMQAKHKIVAINDLTSPEMLAHLLKYDSTHGKFEKQVKAGKSSLIVGRTEIPIFSEKDPENLPWKKLKVDVVLECTGFFRTKESLEKHLKAGAKKVILSAPAKGDDIKTIVLGVNEQDIDKKDKIISNASCTTNSLAPFVKLIHEKYGFLKGLMTTVHAYTNDQNILDLPHSDFRRARAAAVNSVPTTTGAAIAVTEVIPDLKGKLDGIAIRVPVPDGSITDLSFQLDKEVDVITLNNLVKKACSKELKGILEYSEEPLVSSDIINNPNSGIFDSKLTKKVGDMYKVFIWYDNEYGYSNRMVDLIDLI